MLLQKPALLISVIFFFLNIVSIDSDANKIYPIDLAKSASLNYKEAQTTPCSTVLVDQFTMTVKAPFSKTINIIEGEQYYFTVSGTLTFFSGICAHFDAYYDLTTSPKTYCDWIYYCNYPNAACPPAYNPAHSYSSCSFTAGPNPLIFTFGDSYYPDNCGSLYFSVYHIINTPIVNLGIDTTLCQGNSLILDAGNPGDTYLWSNNATSQTISVTSPGQYSVTVTSGGNNLCSTKDTINVSVSPLSIPVITGNQECCQGSTGNLYTTEPGMTTYNWNISSGGTITTGGSITDSSVLVSWDAFGPQTVSAKYTNGNGCSVASPTVYNINVNPTPVPMISGTTSACIASAENVYTAQSGMSGYLWSVSAGGTITAGGSNSDNTITITWNNPGPQSVGLNYTDSNGCTATNSTIYNVTVNPVPIPIITGPTSVCYSSSGNVYTAQSGMTGYLWSISAGGTITSGGTNTDNTITITWNNSGPQTVGVNYTDGKGCTASTSTIYTINVNPLPIPTVSGISSVCSTSSGNTYSSQAGMSGYLWNVSAGGTITAGGSGSDNTITINWNNPGLQTVGINYTDGNGCTAMNSTIYSVTVNPVPIPIITGPTSVCFASSGNTYTTQSGMTGYLWNISAGGIITAGGTYTDNTITITWNNSGPQNVAVNYTDGKGCTASTLTIYTISVNPLPIPTISGISSVCSTSAGNTYSTQAGMSGYIWNTSAGGNITAGGTIGDNTATITWNNPGPQTVSVNYSDANSCIAGTSTVSNIVVNSLPVPVISGTASPCLTSAGNTYSTQAGMTGYLWNISGGGVITAGGTSVDNTVTITWIIPGPQTVSVSYTDENGCTPATSTARIVNVQPLPIPTIEGPPSSCVTSATNVYFTQPGMSMYFWDISSGGSIIAGGTNMDNTVTIKWNFAGPQTVKVKYTDGSGCIAVTSTVYYVSVNPLPVPAISGPALACISSTGNTYITQDGMNGYLWATSPGGSISSGGTNADHLANIIWNTPGPHTVSINYTDEYGCTAIIPTVYLVDVNPLPVPTIAGPNLVCLPSGSSIYTTQTNMTAYVWSISGGGNINSGEGTKTISVTWNTAGSNSVSVSYTDSKGCTPISPSEYPITVNPAPIIDFSTNSACASDTTVFTISGDYLQKISTWHWNFGDGTFATSNAPFSPVHLYTNYDTYTVILSVVDTNGCTYTVTHPVEVLPHPMAFFSVNTPNCLGNITNFIDLSTNPNSQGYLRQWIWNFGDGSPADTIYFPNSPNITHQYATQGSYNVKLFVTNNRGCSSSFQMLVTVDNHPLSDFGYWSNCQDQTAIFIDNSNENLGGQITTWLWDFGDPTTGALNVSSLQNPTHIYTASGNFYVNLITTNLNGCSDTTQKLVNVKAAPEADFFISPSCINSTTLFLADSMVINIPATATYAWNFGDGATQFGRYASHIYLSPGTFNVTLTITDTAGCEGVRIHPITVNPPPTAHFSASTDNCQGQAVALTDLSSTTTGYLNKWEWNFGDGNTQTIVFPNLPNTTHTYSVAGSFNVILTVTNSDGCAQSKSQQVNILNAPTAVFTSTGHCKEIPVSFTDNSTVTVALTISGWNWNFGDVTSGIYNTSNLQNPTHSFATAGIYQIKLITFTENGCSDTTSKSITIDSSPAVDFTTQSGCVGNPALFTPSGMAANAIATWYWSFGDGSYSTAQAPTYLYTSAGTYTVTLIVNDTSGCTNTKSKLIIIAPLPEANFGYTTPTCKGDAVSFSDMSSTASGYVVKWKWEFGDGNVQTITFPSQPAISHTYANAGTFNVTLTVKTNDSCTNHITRVVTILPKPTAAFIHGAACLGSPIAFNDMSISNTTGSISSWSWNFGDPASGISNNSVLQLPTHIYAMAGNYNVSLIVSIPGGCSDTVTQQITISAPPTVDFTPEAGCNNDTTQFTSAVNIATTAGWYWQFGDGTTSFVANPIHIYATQGTYIVTLAITDTASCVNTKSKPVIVIPGPIASFISSTPGCSGLPITFTDLSNANGGSLSTWLWNFGDGTDTTFSAATSSFEHTYAQPGTFVVTLQVLSGQGCENMVQHTVTISSSPLAAFDYDNTCQGQTTQLTDATSMNGGSTLIQHLWNFGDPTSGMLNTSTLTNPIHNFTQAGTFVASLATMNANGCVDTIQQNIIITAKPDLDFYNDSLVCFGSLTTLYTDTIATNTHSIQYYDWNFGDGSPHAFTKNASHQYAVASTFNVTLTVQDTSGCSNIKTKPLTIHAAPATIFSYAGVCENTATQFTDLSAAPVGDTIVSWYWKFGIIGSTTDTSTLKNPTFIYTLPGSYTVSLTTATENGCSSTKSLPLQVWNTPTAQFSYSASPCANGLVQFQDSSWSYQGTVNSWQWVFEPYQFGTGTNPSHLYYAIDSCYEVKLTIQDIRGCVDTITRLVCVPPKLQVGFTNTVNCLGNAVSFVPQMITPAAPMDSLITFNWNFGDPLSGTANISTKKTPAHVFSSVGFYTVHFTTVDKFGCTATTYKEIQVNALPEAGFSYTSGFCDSTIVFSSTSVDTSSMISTYIWQYGDGTSDTLTTIGSIHKYIAPGDYMATLTIINANGCTNTFTDTVSRSACIVATYLTAENSICQNYDLVFTDKSSSNGVISQWVWDFGDGTPSTTYALFQPTVNHIFLNTGTFIVKLKVSTLVGTSIVSDSTKLDVLVKPTPLAGFTVNHVCLGERTVFSDTTLANGSQALFYHWEFGDTGTVDTSDLKNPSFKYSLPGSYTTQMVVKNQVGCADTATTNTIVNGLPSASYTNSLACAGQQTYFFDASQSFIAPISQWGWKVIDSLVFIGNMQGATPFFNFDSVGNYMVMLTVADTNGCIDKLVKQVSVNASPTSALNYAENVDNIQGQVQFTNGSIGGNTFFWDFGNGETAYDESPLVTFADDGTYLVTLVAISDLGCQDSTTISYEMMFKGLYVPNALTAGGTISSTRIWKPIGVNLATYQAEIYNSHGMLVWSSNSLDEKGSPTESWDGTYKQKNCQQDVYVWKITAIFRDGSIWTNSDIGEHEGLSETVHGTITVIR